MDLLTSTPRSGKGHKDILVATNSTREGSVGQHLDRTWRGNLLFGFGPGLGGDELLERCHVTTALIVYRVFAFAIKVLDRWEALDAILDTQVFVLIAIHAGNIDCF